MISVIGAKRILILFILLVINGVLGAAVYLYLVPQIDVVEKEERTLSMQVRTVQSDIKRMQIEFDMLDKQQDKFDMLKEDGFFSSQTRSDAKDLLSTIQRDSNVISAVVSVKSGLIEDNKEAKKSHHNILMSPVQVEISATDDVDIFRYLEIAERKFTGHLRLDGITIVRTRDVTSEILRSIAGGNSPEMVRATALFSWRTMIPESQVIGED